MSLTSHTDVKTHLRENAFIGFAGKMSSNAGEAMGFWFGRTSDGELYSRERPFSLNIGRDCGHLPDGGTPTS